MNKLLLYFFVVLISFPSFSNIRSKLDDVHHSLIDADLEDARLLSKKLLDLEAATLDFYYKKNRWPVNKDELVSDGYYFGSFNTVYGTEISFSIVGDSARFNVDVNDDYKASHIAALISAKSEDDVVIKQFGKPSQSTIIQTSLSKIYDGDIGRNTMETDLYLDGNDLLDANDIHGNTLRGAGGVFDGGVRVFSENNAPSKSHVGLSNLENYSISNSYILARPNFYASEKAVSDSHSALLAKIAALTKSDVGLGNVQNFDVTSDYRGKSKTLYTTQFAVNQAYNALNESKLNKTATAYNSSRLGGLDVSAFARSGLKINGYTLTNHITLTKKDFELGNVQNFGISHSFNGSSKTKYASQFALNAAWEDLNEQIENIEFDTSDLVKKSQKINGKALTGDITLDKCDIGLCNVPNYKSTNKYDDNKTDLLITQRALFNAFTDLNGNKLGKNEKAKDADLLDGIDSASFVQTSRTINGKNLGRNITLNKGDIGLNNVKNYGISDSINGSSSTVYASQKAVGDLYRSTLKPTVIKKYEGSNIGGEGWGADIYECNPNSLTMNVSGHRRIKSGRQTYSTTSFAIKLKKNFKRTTSPTVLSVTADLLFGVSRGDEIASKLLEESIFPSLFTSYGDHDESGLKFSWSWLNFKYYNVDKSNDSKGYSFSATGEVDDCVFN